MIEGRWVVGGSVLASVCKESWDEMCSVCCCRMGALQGQDPLRAGKMDSGFSKSFEPILSIQQHLLSTYSVSHVQSSLW